MTTTEEQIAIARGRAEKRLDAIREKVFNEELLMIFKDEQTVTNALEGIADELAKKKGIDLKSDYSFPTQCRVCKRFFASEMGLAHHKTSASH